MPSNDAAQAAQGGDDGLQVAELVPKAMDLIGKVIAPTTLLVALLYYFGWVRTNALYLYFGIDQSVLGFSLQDYLLRSAATAFASARWLLILSLAAVWGHIGLGRLMKSRLASRHTWLALWPARLILAVGVLLVLGSDIAVRFGPYRWIRFLYYPLVWTAGVVLIAYGVRLYAQRRKAEAALRRAEAEADKPADKGGQGALPQPAQSEAPESGISRGLYQLSWGLVIAILFAGLFWIVADYAQLVGRQQAEQTAAGLTRVPSVIVYSRDPLSLEVPGVTEVEVSGGQSVYRYRYTGLRFLVRSGEKYFLLPESWSLSRPVSIILPDSDSIRVEMASGETRPLW